MRGCSGIYVQSQMILRSLIGYRREFNLLLHPISIRRLTLYLETVMTKMLDYKNEPDSILEELMPWSEAIQKSCGLNNGTI